MLNSLWARLCHGTKKKKARGCNPTAPREEAVGLWPSAKGRILRAGVALFSEVALLSTGTLGGQKERVQNRHSVKGSSCAWGLRWSAMEALCPESWNLDMEVASRV